MFPFSTCNGLTIIASKKEIELVSALQGDCTCLFCASKPSALAKNSQGSFKCSQFTQEFLRGIRKTSIIHSEFAKISKEFLVKTAVVSMHARPVI